MANGTKIEWADETWNPVTGCSRASAGCDHCYAVHTSWRMERMGQEKYAGLTVLNGKGDRHFNGTVRCHEDVLGRPLTWRKPRRIFVNSMSDLFHADVPDEFIDRVFAVMALCPKHQFLILTKRPERMAAYLTSGRGVDVRALTTIPLKLIPKNMTMGDTHFNIENGNWKPLPNVWVGVSCEDQAAADARIPHLLRTPAAVRFLSCEPLLGPIDLWGPRYPCAPSGECGAVSSWRTTDRIDWVIVGGESGGEARPCDVGWIRGIVDTCKGAGVPCFVKQLGAKPYAERGPAEAVAVAAKMGFGPVVGEFWRLLDHKGGNPAEWPAELRVREFPE
jgi:protein gp37